MIVAGYHTLEDKDNYDQIELEGPFDCTHKGAWLGRGSYFWDTNINWAHEWGDIGYKRRGKDYVITETLINLEESCFDLFGNVECRNELLECIEVLSQSKQIKNRNSATISNLIEFMKEKKIFHYKSIRASDISSYQLRIKFRMDRLEYMILNDRVQICVINRKDVILQPLKVIFPEI